MLPAVPSGEYRMTRNSKKVNNAGNANTLNHDVVCNTSFLVIVMIRAKISGTVTVKMITGTRGATFNRKKNKLNLPIKYAIKATIKALLPLTCNAITKTGIGAIQSRYQ